MNIMDKKQYVQLFAACVFMTSTTNAFAMESTATMNKDNEATVKTFYKENGHFRLQPENEFMDSIVLDERNIEVIGVVRGVFRTL